MNPEFKKITLMKVTWFSNLMIIVSKQVIILMFYDVELCDPSLSCVLMLNQIQICALRKFLVVLLSIFLCGGRVIFWILMFLCLILHICP